MSSLCAIESCGHELNAHIPHDPWLCQDCGAWCVFIWKTGRTLTDVINTAMLLGRGIDWSIVKTDHPGVEGARSTCPKCGESVDKSWKGQIASCAACEWTGYNPVMHGLKV